MAFNFVIPGLGHTLSYSTTSGGSYTDVGQLKDIEGTNSEVGMWDSSGISSTAGEQVPTLFKAGDYSFKVIFDPANATHVALHGYHVAKTLLYWKQTFPSPIGPGASAPGSPKTYAFPAYIKSFATSGYDSESGLEGSIGLAITGAPTLA